MTTPRRPQDRRPKAQPSGKDKPFTYKTAAGDITLAPVEGTITAGFYRKNRGLSIADQLMVMVEELADEDSIEVFDQMSLSELAGFQTAFEEHMGGSVGESPASS